MHIPKTGGMSLFTAFATLWGTDIVDLYDISPRRAEVAATAALDHSKILYCGHYAFGLHAWFDRPTYYASVLREPVSRLVSLYYYCQPMISHYTTLLQKVNGNVAKLVSLPKTSDFYFDFVPCMQGVMNAETFFGCPSPELDNGMVRRFSGYGLKPTPCPAHALDVAKRNIETYFSVIGLLDRYAETLELFAKVFGLPSLVQNHVNANPKSKAENEPLAPEIIERIRSMNPLDIALYDWVEKRFDTTIAAVGKPITVPGGGRKDAIAMPLWRAVGTSPLREATMKSRGLPKKGQTAKPRPLLCNRLVWAGVNAKAVMIDLDTVQIRDGKGIDQGPRTRLVLDPKTARIMAKTLNDAVTAYEQKFGAVPAAEDASHDVRIGATE
jgi:hypothetical protein